eukprot:11245640-Alexandrium_andersonii.AAC.1
MTRNSTRHSPLENKYQYSNTRAARNMQLYMNPFLFPSWTVVDVELGTNMQFKSRAALILGLSGGLG